MQPAPVEVHRKAPEIFDAVNRTEVGIVLVSRVSAGPRKDDEVIVIHDRTGIHEASMGVVRPAGDTACRKPVQAVYAVMQEEPSSFVPRATMVSGFAHPIPPTQQILGVCGQVAQHPVHPRFVIRDHKEFALRTRPACFF